MPDLDSFDVKILRLLRSNGRMTTLEIAERVGLSPTPCSRRIKRLEETGVIVGYKAVVSPASLGLTISVVITVRLAKQGPEANKQFLEGISQCPEITECLLLTGSIDYMLRVWVADIAALRVFITSKLQSIPAVGETSTMVILDVANGIGV